jgi:hypothetical protein
MPITPNIIQTMKHTVNASVLTISTESACPFFVMSKTPFLHDMTLGRSGFAWHPSEGAARWVNRTTLAPAPIVPTN